jgi:signal transduction histidine kinase
MTENNPIQCDAHALITKTVDLYYNPSGTQVTFTPTNVIKSPLIYIDPQNFDRVIGNLIKNATQAISDDNEYGKVLVSTKLTKGKLQISIQDNGVGIPKELADKIFQPNFSTKNSGMGLGLSIVKNIVESAKGKIWFKTELKKGTTFFIELPLLEEDEN